MPAAARHRPAIVLLVLLSAASAVGCARSENPRESLDSGVRGVVVLGPTCPVETEWSPCPDRPWAGTVRATRGADSVEIATDADGRFTMPLEPGTWALTALADRPGPPSASPVDVRVAPHRFTTVTLTLGTGIR